MADGIQADHRDPRDFIVGAHGTGKTWPALAVWRRAVYGGHQVVAIDTKEGMHRG